MGRKTNPDGIVFRSVLLFENPDTGERKALYSPPYASKGPATAFGNANERGYFYTSHQWEWDAATRTGSYIDRKGNERLPFVEKWVEVAETWRRV